MWQKSFSLLKENDFEQILFLFYPSKFVTGFIEEPLRFETTSLPLPIPNIFCHVIWMEIPFLLTLLVFHTQNIFRDRAASKTELEPSDTIKAIDSLALG